MKRCHACGEEFESHFSFCPIDGRSLGRIKILSGGEYRPTLISDQSLPLRLTAEVRFVIDQLKRVWPRFKADPLKFFQTAIRNLTSNFRQLLARPHLVPGLMTAVAVISCVVFAVVIFDQTGRDSRDDDAAELVPETVIDFRTESDTKSDLGIGAGDKGRVGFDQGRGEGSRPTPARAHGGGGGGELVQLQSSQGKIPIPSAIPAAIPTTYARLPPAALPVAGIDIDRVLWKDMPFPNYGDPRSKSTVASNGPGEGGGVGTGKGSGIGEGEDNGFGPGRKGNTGDGENERGDGREGGSRGNNPDNARDRVYKISEVTTRARVLAKPEPQYTEEARRNQITGAVVLSVVFSRDGQVINIRPVQTLCCGLTEKAIAAARLIRFVPATRNGQAVPTYMQLVYNFNLY